MAGAVLCSENGLELAELIVLRCGRLNGVIAGGLPAEVQNDWFGVFGDGRRSRGKIKS